MDEKSTVVGGTEDEELKDIRSQMDQTKRDLASAFQDIRERYSPDRMKQGAKEAADDLGEKAMEMFQKRRGDIKRVADRVGETIRNNPIPFAAAGAAGIGLSAWALFKGEGGMERTPPEPYSSLEEQRAVAGYYPEEASAETEGCATVAEEEGRIGQMAGQLGEKAKSLGESARVRSERLRANFIQVVKDHPFLIGAATFGLGILSGLIFPSTRPEDQMLGGVREKVREKAQEIKEEAKESAQRVVEETKRAAQQEAEKHGLTT